MKSIFLGVTLAIFSTVAFSSNLVHQHPSSGGEVVFAGAPGTEAYVCYFPYLLVGPGPKVDPKQVCEFFPLNGAMDPVSILVFPGTPVRVQYARWAYTSNSHGDLIPMQAYNPQY